MPVPPKGAHEAGSPATSAPQGTHEPTLAPAPSKAGPSHVPPAPAVVTPPREPVKGEVFTLALIKIMDDQVNKPWFGWRPNTIVFGKMGLTDNVNNLQLGVLEVARRTVVVLNEHMTRFATTEAYNPRVNEAMNFFMVSPGQILVPVGLRQVPGGGAKPGKIYRRLKGGTSPVLFPGGLPHRPVE